MSQLEPVGYVYALKRNDVIFYIGQTTGDPETRLKQHQQRFGKDITISVIEEVSLKYIQGYRNLNKAEIVWIKHYSELLPLENGSFNPQWKGRFA